MTDRAVLTLILVAVLATDVAVAALFVSGRSHLRALQQASDRPSRAAAVVAAVTAVDSELRHMALELRQELEQLRAAVAELRPAAKALATPRDIKPPASVGRQPDESIYAAARRIGVSAEEIRLRTALRQQHAAT